MTEGLSISIGALKRLQNDSLWKCKDRNESSNATVSANIKKRQITWSNHTHYRCIREGKRVMRNVDEINSIAQPEEADFFIYQNTHVCAQRDIIVPLYEAAYKCMDGTLIRVQKKHLKAAYMSCNRRDTKQAWSVDQISGLPYWVDRFAFSKTK